MNTNKNPASVVDVIPSSFLNDPIDHPRQAARLNALALKR